MADVDFQVSFTTGEREGAFQRFEPGSAVIGSVQVDPKENVRSRAIRAKLSWHTEGRGDTDSKTIEERVLAEGGLMAGLPQRFTFDFRLPGEPWSYAGHYLNIIWSLVITVDVPLARDTVHRERIIVAPQR